MGFAGINYMAILVAAVAAFMFGGAYYTALSKPWREAAGRSDEDIASSSMAVPLAVTAVSLLVMAWVLAGIIGHLGPGQVTARTGVISGAFCWLGFIITALATNHAYQGARRSLTLIDGGYWLGVLLIQGLVIGWMGVKG